MKVRRAARSYTVWYHPYSTSRRALMSNGARKFKLTQLTFSAVKKRLSATDGQTDRQTPNIANFGQHANFSLLNMG